jgi:hypothetical protein
MSKIIALDTTPLGIAAQLPGRPDVDACQQWISNCIAAGHRIIVPEIADYEVRRELTRAGKTAGVGRLDLFNSAQSDRLVSITNAAMRLAATLWARARNHGYATADPKALDGDVILAAQVLTLGYPIADVIVATENVGHLSRYVTADDWQNIVP